MQEKTNHIKTRKSLEMRQQEVIDAALARSGATVWLRTTLADIAKEAGLGTGISASVSRRRKRCCSPPFSILIGRI